jgi:hypothetical protein
MSRLIIYPKEISSITGKNYKSSWQLLLKIKKYYGKDDHQFVTIKEFSSYTGIPEAEVLAKILH